MPTILSRVINPLNDRYPSFNYSTCTRLTILLTSFTMAPKFELTEANFRRIYDFVPGLPFCDIMPALKTKETFKGIIDLFLDAIKTKFPEGVDYVCGVELRGVTFAPAIAYALGVGLVVLRKKGKLPGLTHSYKFMHDYAEAELELQVDAVEPGAKVVVVDDVLATGGTLKACCELLKKIHADVLGCLVMVEFPAAPGRENFERDLPGVRLCSLVKLTFHASKPVFDPADLEQEKKEFQEFLKGLWKDDKTVEEASKGTVRT